MIVEGFRVEAGRMDAAAPSDAWPWTVPAVAQLARDGLRLRAPITVLVGENGAGKSTIVEAMAESYGVDVRGGHGARRYASPLAKSVLGDALRFDRGSLYGMARGAGYFLRAETAMGVLEYMTGAGIEGYGDELAAEVSHGEGFLQLFRGRFEGPGLYLLDEPESALSFTSSLALVSTLMTVATERGQVICATHSPILAAIPGADIIQVNRDGFHRTTWEDLEMVGHWQRFLSSPEQYLRHLR